MLDRENVARIVEDCFRDTPRPGDDESDLFDNPLPHAQEFMSMIKGKDWKAFLEVLETSDHYWAMTYGEMWLFMSDSAYYYFAPALLIFSLNPSCDTLQMEICHDLTLRDSDAFRRTGYLTSLMFSDAQKDAIAYVVEYYVYSYPGIIDGERDLWEHWRRRLGR